MKGSDSRTGTRDVFDGMGDALEALRDIQAVFDHVIPDTVAGHQYRGELHRWMQAVSNLTLGKVREPAHGAQKPPYRRLFIAISNPYERRPYYWTATESVGEFRWKPLFQCNRPIFGERMMPTKVAIHAGWVRRPAVVLPGIGAADAAHALDALGLDRDHVNRILGEHEGSDAGY